MYLHESEKVNWLALHFFVDPLTNTAKVPRKTLIIFQSPLTHTKQDDNIIDLD